MYYLYPGDAYGVSRAQGAPGAATHLPLAASKHELRLTHEQVSNV